MQNNRAGLDEIRKTLIDGLRQSGQGSYRRRAPNTKALPLLRQARRGLNAFVSRETNDAEAWRLLSLAHEALLSYGPAIASLKHAIAASPSTIRKDLTRLKLLEENEQEWESLGLDPQELRALGDYLDEQMRADPCDHGPRHARAWLSRHRPGNADRVLREFQARGGYCDCEIAMNIIV